MRRAARPGRISSFAVFLAGLAAVGNLLGPTLSYAWVERGPALWLPSSPWELLEKFFSSIRTVVPISLAAGFIAHRAGGRNRILTAMVVLVCSLSLLPVGTLYVLSPRPLMEKAKPARHAPTT